MSKDPFQLLAEIESKYCPKCQSVDVDIDWLNGEAGTSGWSCFGCNHSWTEGEVNT